MKRIVPLIVITTLILAQQVSGQNTRVALIVGNANYINAPLKNPINDAMDISIALIDIGYEVILINDANRKMMYNAIEQFGQKIRNANIALFYYSGHGVQIDGENYLIPTEAEISVATDIESEGVQLSRIIGRMNTANAQTNIIFLDACRNNPFPKSSRGMERGLAVVGQKPPESMIVYSTEAGETADDGDDRNGVFTKALLNNIKKNMELSQIIRDVNAEVRNETGQKQRPAKYDNLTHSVYLSGAIQENENSNQNTELRRNDTNEKASQVSLLKMYGSLIITTETLGRIYIDGVEKNELGIGMEARINSVDVGEREVEIRYANKQKMIRKVIIEKGKESIVTFPKYVSTGENGLGGRVFYRNDFGNGMVVTTIDVSSKSNWIEANNKCNKLVQNGFDDWRLPSIEELSTIGKVFSMSGKYWSREIPRIGMALVKDFDTGKDISENTFSVHKVIAVRSF